MDILVWSTLMFLCVWAMTRHICLGNLLARREKERSDGCKRFGWRYESVSFKDAAFRISGTSDGMRWLLEQQKTNTENWTVTWSAKIARYDGEIVLGSRRDVEFFNTRLGGVFITFMAWKLWKEHSEDLELIKKELNHMHLLQLQNPFLRKDYVIAVPPQDESLALGVFDTLSLSQIEAILRDWPNESGQKHIESFHCELARVRLQIKIDKKLMSFESVEQLIKLGLHLLHNYQKESAKRSK